MPVAGYDLMDQGIEPCQKFSEHSWIMMLLREYDKLDADTIDKGNEIICVALDKLERLNRGR